MWNTLSQAVVLMAALAGAGTAGARSSEELTLKSAYTDKPVLSGARQIHVWLKLDEKGNGSGSITFDPNIHDEWGSTCIAIRHTPVRVRLVQEEGSTVKGRWLYELRPVGDEGKVKEDGEHWHLVRPLKAGAPCWLLVTDEPGRFQDAVRVE